MTEQQQAAIERLTMLNVFARAALLDAGAVEPNGNHSLGLLIESRTHCMVSARWDATAFLDDLRDVLAMVTKEGV